MKLCDRYRMRCCLLDYDGKAFARIPHWPPCGETGRSSTTKKRPAVNRAEMRQDMNEDILTHDKNNALRLAMASVESLIVVQCSYTDKLLKEPESLGQERAAMIETAFRALNHLSITLQRLQSVCEEREKQG